MRIERFEDIEAWKAARNLVKSVYGRTRAKPFHQDLDLRRQMRRAAVSVMSNIAEGFDSGSDPEFARFLRISRRSASEIHSHLYVCVDQEYLDTKAFDALYAEARKTEEWIGGFLRYLKPAARTKPDVGRKL